MKKFLAVLSLVLLASTQAHALNTQNLRYYSPSGRAISLVESKPAEKDTFNFGMGFNWALNPLEIGSTPTGVRVSGVVDHIFTFDLIGAYSFTDKIAIGIDVPIHVSRHLASTAGTAMETKANIGDITISGHINIIDPDDNSINAGLGLVPFVTIPSGKSSDWIGDSTANGGLLVAGDIDIDGHYIGLNLGVRLRKTENFNNLSVGNEFMYNLAYHHVLVPSFRLDGFAEINGSTVLKDFWQKANGSPFEARLGVTKAFMEQDQLKVTVASGLGLGNGFGAPDYRQMLKVTYAHAVDRTPRPAKVEESIPVRIQRIEKELKELTIYYPTDGDQVDPFYDQKISSIADILRKNPDLGPLYIVGHTDDVGSVRYNQRLSERRSKRAYDSIVGHGLNPLVIVSMGLGESYPVVPNTSDANRALNRRTLFTFIKPAQLESRQKRSGEMVGYNSITGKKNDSYTEVLKELESSKTGDPTQKTVVTRRYKDKSQVIVDEEGTTQTKDTPRSEAQEIENKPKSKKYYIEKEVEGQPEDTTESGTVIKRKAKKKKVKKSSGKQSENVVEETIYDDY